MAKTLALAFVVIGFTRRMASAGYAYTYASRSLRADDDVGCRVPRS